MTTKVLVVYDTTFGNTKAVAEAIAKGVGAGSTEVDVRSLDDTTELDVLGADFLVVGAPMRRGGGTTPRVRSFLRDLPDGHGRAAAAFETFVHKPLAGDAARSIADRLDDRHWNVVVPPMSFVEHGPDRPLVWGEVGRAQAWGALIVGYAERAVRPLGSAR